MMTLALVLAFGILVGVVLVRLGLRLWTDEDFRRGFLDGMRGDDPRWP